MTRSEAEATLKRAERQHLIAIIWCFGIGTLAGASIGANPEMIIYLIVSTFDEVTDKMVFKALACCEIRKVGRAREQERQARTQLQELFPTVDAAPSPPKTHNAPSG